MALLVETFVLCESSCEGIRFGVCCDAYCASMLAVAAQMCPEWAPELHKGQYKYLAFPSDFLLHKIHKQISRLQRQRLLSVHRHVFITPPVGRRVSFVSSLRRQYILYHMAEGQLGQGSEQ